MHCVVPVCLLRLNKTVHIVIIVHTRTYSYTRRSIAYICKIHHCHILERVLDFDRPKVSTSNFPTSDKVHKDYSIDPILPCSFRVTVLRCCLQIG